MSAIDPAECGKLSKTTISDFENWQTNFDKVHANSRFAVLAWEHLLAPYFVLAQVPMDLQNWLIWVRAVIPQLQNNGHMFQTLKNYAFYRFFYFSHASGEPQELSFMDEVDHIAKTWFGEQASNECILAVFVTIEVMISLDRICFKLGLNQGILGSLAQAISNSPQESHLLPSLQEMASTYSAQEVQEMARTGKVPAKFFHLGTALSTLQRNLATQHVSQLFSAFQKMSALDVMIAEQVLRQSNQVEGLLSELLAEQDYGFETIQVYDPSEVQIQSAPANSNNNINNNSQNNQMFSHKHAPLQTAQEPPNLLPKMTPNNLQLPSILSIVTQPPSSTVYKRNLRPFPQVMLNQSQSDPLVKKRGTLYAVPLLVRCDSYVDESRYLLGGKAQEISPGRIVTFKKLKITTTSHQQGETLFCLRVELRRYLSDDDLNTQNFTIEDLIYTNPITVLSHSTQLKPVPTIIPVIMEIIPNYAGSLGGDRVVVIGSNLGEGPSCRVKFGDEEVGATFWGPGTWIVHAPRHDSGNCQVRVSNDAKTWSTTAVDFFFDETEMNWEDFD